VTATRIGEGPVVAVNPLVSPSSDVVLTDGCEMAVVVGLLVLTLRRPPAEESASTTWVQRGLHCGLSATEYAGSADHPDATHAAHAAHAARH
jgi:hypothetical protein